MNKFDIIFSPDRKDFKLEPTDKYKGQNICSVQLGSLNGGPSIGIDFAQFVKGEIEFSLKTFQTHIINQLTVLDCSVSSIDVTQNDLDGSMSIGVR